MKLLFVRVYGVMNCNCMFCWYIYYVVSMYVLNVLVE